MWGVLLAGMQIACGSEARPTIALPSDDACDGRADGTLCMSEVALQCAGGETAARTDCGVLGQQCVEPTGCRACVPQAISCDGDLRYRCRADGSQRELVEQCASGTWCSASGCRDLCADAAAARSYLGCDYWPVFTANRRLPAAFQPAVAIGNGNLVTAQVEITRGTQVVASVEVPARASTTVTLAYDLALQRSTGSSLLRAGAYHLHASVPVTVHQFNPLLFELPGDCPGEEPAQLSADGICNSHTNDASLLLPATALGPDTASGATEVTYLVVSRATFIGDLARLEDSGAGFVAIVAGGARPVNVRITVSAFTAASIAGEPVEALAPGETLARTLAPGDVLQLLSRTPGDCPGTVGMVGSRQVCDPGARYDLTGSEVRADGPIEVIGGHDCSYVPFDRVACDHLEESLPPLHAWGNDALLTRTRVAPETSSLVRVVSGSDQNLIRFDPPLRAPLTLDRGQFVELLIDQPVYVRGSGRLLAAQYLVGQGAYLNVGDPSLSIGVPVDQYRFAYNFVTPPTYSVNYADIIATTGEPALLDGVPVTGFVPVGGSGFSVATVNLARSGAHELLGGASRGLGLVLYGVGAYTSYMLPGGLDLTPLSDEAI